MILELKLSVQFGGDHCFLQKSTRIQLIQLSQRESHSKENGDSHCSMLLSTGGAGGGRRGRVAVGGRTAVPPA